MIRIVSPHLDDAVLSLGQMIAAADDDVEVVTVFAGFPPDGPDGPLLSPYDESCGFESSRAAMEERRLEDLAACSMLGATVRHLDFLDGQYWPGGRPWEDDLEVGNALAPLWDDAERVYAPVGIGHPDHALVGRAARFVCPRPGTMFLYEELPYRVLWPEMIAAEFLYMEHQTGCVRAELPDPAPVGDRQVKADAIAEYRSQFPSGATDPCLLVPERAWRIAKP